MHQTTYQDSPISKLFLAFFNPLKLDNTANVFEISVLFLLSSIDNFKFESKEQEKSKKKIIFFVCYCTVNCKYIEHNMFLFVCNFLSH